MAWGTSPPGSYSVKVAPRLEPGSESSCDLARGSSAVRMLEIQIDPQDAPQVLRSVVLEAAFDGEPTVWCPLGEFFGCGGRLPAVKDWDRSVAADGKLTAPLGHAVSPVRPHCRQKPWEDGCLDRARSHGRSLGVG